MSLQITVNVTCLFTDPLYPTLFSESRLSCSRVLFPQGNQIRLPFFLRDREVRKQWKDRLQISVTQESYRRLAPVDHGTCDRMTPCDFRGVGTIFDRVSRCIYRTRNKYVSLVHQGRDPSNVGILTVNHRLPVRSKVPLD